MRKGGSKAKGSSFERKLCKMLSLWVSHGKNEDVFWRSAMSGGRATVAARKCKKLTRQAGDISAIAPEGHILTNRYYVELKHVKNLALLQFFTKGSGPLAEYWKKAKQQAALHGLEPLIIARQNNLPMVLVCTQGTVDVLTCWHCQYTERLTIKKRRVVGIEIWRLEDVLACKFGLEE